MQFILAEFFRQHNQHAAWWYKIKINPAAQLDSANNVLLPSDEAPGQHCLSKLLGITMNELWNVLIACKLAKKTQGKRGPMLDQHKILEFISSNSLTDFLELTKTDSQSVLRVGAYSSKSSTSDHKPKTQ
jgi:hypothetical protein